MNQLIGDTGWQLSHGERSPLYLARALPQDGELVLLDESFGALGLVISATTSARAHRHSSITLRTQPQARSSFALRYRTPSRRDPTKSINRFVILFYLPPVPLVTSFWTRQLISSATQISSSDGQAMA